MLCKNTSGNLKVSRVKKENSKSFLKQHVVNLWNIMICIAGKELIAGCVNITHIK